MTPTQTLLQEGKVTTYTVFCRAPAHRKHPEPLALFSSPFKHGRPRWREPFPSGALGGGLSPYLRHQEGQGRQTSPRTHGSYRFPVPLAEAQGEPARRRAQLGLSTRKSKCKSLFPTPTPATTSSKVKINTLLLK